MDNEKEPRDYKDVLNDARMGKPVHLLEFFEAYNKYTEIEGEKREELMRIKKNIRKVIHTLTNSNLFWLSIGIGFGILFRILFSFVQF